MVDFAELPAPPGTRFSPVRLVAETGSTNADLLERAGAGERAGSVLVTDHQRAGRGRQQRVWHDEPGNSLLVSVLLRPEPSQAPLLPLVTGLAAVDAVARTLEQAADGPGSVPPAGRQAGLKWPNDVLVPALGERKLAGILAEATSSGPSSSLAVVVGMGLNLRWMTPPPAEIERRLVTLTEVVGGPVDRDQVLGHFLVALESWLQALDGGRPVLDAYREACLTLGRQVRFTSVGTVHEGQAVAVSDTGSLILESADGDRVELNAGDAHHV
ncbi:MAG: biotin--[acetyl-CoA-carboxylase] ligase [Actinomycetota bacterium]